MYPVFVPSSRNIAPATAVGESRTPSLPHTRPPFPPPILGDAPSLLRGAPWAAAQFAREVGLLNGLVLGHGAAAKGAGPRACGALLPTGPSGSTDFGGAMGQRARRRGKGALLPERATQTTQGLRGGHLRPGLPVVLTLGSAQPPIRIAGPLRMVRIWGFHHPALLTTPLPHTSSGSPAPRGRWRRRRRWWSGGPSGHPSGGSRATPSPATSPSPSPRGPRPPPCARCKGEGKGRRGGCELRP